MKKEFRVCKNQEFSSIIQHHSFVKSSSFVLYYKKKKYDHARVGISVGKKLGNAVKRNKVKRQVRMMVDSLFHFQEEYDCICIVRPVYGRYNYEKNLAQLSQLKKKIDEMRVLK